MFDIMGVNERVELIRKHLRILIKTLELKKDVDSSKKNLLAHLLLVQEEVLLKSSELEEFFDRKRKTANELLKGQLLTVDEFQTLANGKNIKVDKYNNGLIILDMNKDSRVRGSFQRRIISCKGLIYRILSFE